MTGAMYNGMRVIVSPYAVKTRTKHTVVRLAIPKRRKKYRIRVDHYDDYLCYVMGDLLIMHPVVFDTLKAQAQGAFQ